MPTQRTDDRLVSITDVFPMLVSVASLRSESALQSYESVSTVAVIGFNYSTRYYGGHEARNLDAYSFNATRDICPAPLPR
jgi:hypothetical protein